MKRVLFAVLISGCAHQAKHYEAPDASKLRGAQAEAQQLVKTAKAAVFTARHATQEAQKNHTQAVVSHQKETAEIAAIAEKLDGPEFQSVPPELRVAFAAVRLDVDLLKMQNESTAKELANVTPNLEAASVAQANATKALEDAEKAQFDIERKYGPEYVQEVDVLAQRANDAEIAWAKDSKEIVRLKTASWTYRIAAAIGVLAAGGLTFLWFTGKIVA